MVGVYLSFRTPKVVSTRKPFLFYLILETGFEVLIILQKILYELLKCIKCINVNSKKVKYKLKLNLIHKCISN